MNVWLAANLAALCATGGWVASLALPPARSIRLRNALLLRASTAGDFDWSPAAVPPDFAVERAQPYREFAAVVDALGLDAKGDDWPRALRIAEWLSMRAQDKGPIRSDLVSTLRRIDQGYGYCADFVKVYLGLAHAAGIFARQWAFSFDGFGGHGHTMVEIFDRQRGKWLMLDVFNNFHPIDFVTREPLSALEFRDSLLGRHAKSHLAPNGAGRPGYVNLRTGRDYYRRGLHQWYLSWGNAVFTYDAHPVVRALNRMSGSFGQIAGIVLRVHPTIRALPTERNDGLIRSLARLRSRLRLAFASFAGLCMLLVAQAGVSAPHWAALS